ncbi:hypothetical protein RJT34_19652 [Clitoria ternatea]|uniref:DUF4378 domain-containing protein n=1 Tax=Clitoria ternatea TaxID=43366 RepID=A0AAN9P3T5_CLITE
MAQKHLHELLKEDQEPFLLNKYISDRKNQITKRPLPKTSLQVRKKKPMTHHHQQTEKMFPGNLCKNACFFPFTNTPELRKSPLFEFASPVKSPCKSPNAIFLHIPSRTASLLLEAALRIQKQSSKPKTKAQSFGLLGSLFKRLTQRNQNNRKREIEGGSKGVKVSVKDILKWDSSVSRRKVSNGNKEDENVGFSCSYNVGRPSSAVWSESNEDKSLDMETSSSGHSDDYSEGIQFVTNHKECSCFCESPFRFVLQTSSSPSSGHHTPELPSPSRHTTQDKESNEAERLKKFEAGEEEEEDKEQCSPVCVLEPPFEDDDEGHVNDDDDVEEEGGFDLECSYAIVQRAKKQLMYKLRRFEKLAELDPVELEKRMQDREEDEDETLIKEDDGQDKDREVSYKENDYRELVFQALCHSRVHDRQQIPEDFKKLVSDLIMEEERELNCLEDRDMVITRVCKRLELWKEVESNTIDMMIEEDFTREDGGWKRNVDQIKNVAVQVELAIFGFLVEEFSEDLLVC